MTTVVIPHQVSSALLEKKYCRINSASVDKAMCRLEFSHALFESFFKANEGSFWSTRLGFEFLDLVEGSVNIETSTEACRRQFGFPLRYIVLSELTSGGQVVVLNSANDLVYEVDFEGGENLLLAGLLTPRWDSFETFLLDYFDLQPRENASASLDHSRSA